MQFFERVPCANGESHTSFGITVDTQDEELVVRFFVFQNFKLVDMQWRQDFTNAVSLQLTEQFPDKPHVFAFTRLNTRQRRNTFGRVFFYPTALLP